MKVVKKVRPIWIGISLVVIAMVAIGGYVLLGKSDLAQVPAQAKEYHFTGEVL